jgi:hypothetical protein
MNTLRRIQTFSAAVVVNGVAALTLMGALPAHASTCNPVRFCYPPPESICTGNINAWCASHTPPGCTLQSVICQPPGSCEAWGTGSVLGECDYT